MLLFLFSSRRRHTISVSAFLLNRSSDLSSLFLRSASISGLRRDAVQPDIEAERKKRDEIEAGKSYCSRRFGGATCDDKSAQIYARFDKNDWRIQPAEFYRFHDAEVNTRSEERFSRNAETELVCRLQPEKKKNESHERA